MIVTVGRLVKPFRVDMAGRLRLLKAQFDPVPELKRESQNACGGVVALIHTSCLFLGFKSIEADDVLDSIVMMTMKLGMMGKL